MDNNIIKIIFFGDLVGKPGRTAVCRFLKSNKYDFIIANVENTSHGFGLTEKNYKELEASGIQCMTSGNHIWDKKEVFNYIDNVQNILRPINYPQGTKGIGSQIFSINDNIKIAVINALGRVFMSPIDSPWEIMKCEIEKIKNITPNIIIDFHAEATAEKICLGKYCSQLGATAFLGTHTHVQTADECLINKMAYITDVGFCGASDGVIGMDYVTSLNRFLTCLPERYEVADGETSQINAVEICINSTTGEAISIRRIFDRIINKDEKSEKKD